MASFNNNFRNKSDQLWWEIQDIIGPANILAKMDDKTIFYSKFITCTEAFDLCIRRLQRIESRGTFSNKISKIYLKLTNIHKFMNTYEYFKYKI